MLISSANTFTDFLQESLISDNVRDEGKIMGKYTTHFQFYKLRFKLGCFRNNRLGGNSKKRDSGFYISARKFLQHHLDQASESRKV